MTSKELNQAVKRLNKRIKELPTDNVYKYYKIIHGEIQPEFCRIVAADTSFKSFNADSLRILIRLNVRHRFIAFHHFGINIEL